MGASASFHSEKVEVRSAGKKGLGLFATAAIEPGELLVATAGRVLTPDEFRSYEQGHLPFQIEKDLHLAPLSPETPDGIFAVNHACAPCAAIRGQTSLVALRAIVPDEEITYDYVLTDSDAEDVPAFEMKCLCGAANCRGVITDRDWRREDLRARYRGMFSAYLQARIESELCSAGSLHGPGSNAGARRF
jgi:SET domain-containing protein